MTLRVACHVLDGRVSCIAEARQWVDVFLAAALPAVGGRMVTDAQLAVSELVTNAVQHAPGPCVLQLSDDGRCVEVAVSDSSARPPVDRRAGFREGTGGAGLMMLRRLADAVEVHLRPNGKTVSVLLDRKRRVSLE
jgi:anti-sigma regulatory factor (Ser/Thr protein kinase)